MHLRARHEHRGPSVVTMQDTHELTSLGPASSSDLEIRSVKGKSQKKSQKMSELIAKQRSSLGSQDTCAIPLQERKPDYLERLAAFSAASRLSRPLPLASLWPVLGWRRSFGSSPGGHLAICAMSRIFPRYWRRGCLPVCQRLSQS